MSDIEQAIKSVRDIYVECPKRFGQATDQLKKIDSEIQDILHLIELGTLDAIRMTKMIKELKSLRQQRRKLKNELEVLQEIKEFVSHPKPNEKTINRTLGNVRSIIERQGKRTYAMRVRKDLQELIK